MYAKSDAQSRDNHDLWHVDGSRLALRGPERDLNKPFIAVLGGSETFGKFVDRPYPALLEDRIGRPVVNLGVMHAGASLFSKERWLLDIASGADLTIVQVMGAQNMSNRLYCVHPRRNDRFLTTSAALRIIYPDVDFTEVNFTGHLLETLERSSAARFEIVVEELRWAWVQRMRRIVKSISGDVQLLWMSRRSPDDAARDTSSSDPMFVTRAMLDELSPHIAGVTEVVGKGQDPSCQKVPFACGRSDAPVHAAVADALARDVLPLLATEKGPDLAVEALAYDGDPAGHSFSISSGTAVNRSATRP
ncbi:MAG: DUF6473 family protein [Roseovarius confluentis]